MLADKVASARWVVMVLLQGLCGLGSHGDDCGGGSWIRSRAGVFSDVSGSGELVGGILVRR